MLVYYTTLNDTNWSELSLSYNTPYWEAQIPPLAAGYYSLRTYAADLQNNFIDCEMKPAFLIEEPMDIQDEPETILSKGFQLFQNYPNPFNPSTVISFYLTTGQNVQLTVYSVNGQKIATLLNGYLNEGYHQVNWNGRNDNNIEVSSGIYLYEIRAGDQRFIRKMILTR